MKDVLSAYAVFEFAMFGIMLLFLSFCGFFTFKHCFYMWRRKKRKRRDDSLESILDLLYNEDYYYLESSTPYLPQDEESSNEQAGKNIDFDEDDATENASFASAPTQGRSVRWSGCEKIAMDKFKVCPQAVKTERRDESFSDASPQRKLKRQMNIQLSCSSESMNNQSSSSSLKLPNQDKDKLSPDVLLTPRPHSLPLTEDSAKPYEKYSPGEESPTSSKTKKTSVSIRKIVATSKFIGAAHRARKQMRMQSRFQPGTFRYRPENEDGSFEKRSPNDSSDSRRGEKRKVYFLDPGSLPHGGQARDKREKHISRANSSEKSGRKLRPPRSAFRWFPRPLSTDTGIDERHFDRHDDRSASTDVEELCQEYERLEKTRYAEMLKKAKSLRRENLPFFNRKHNSS